MVNANKHANAMMLELSGHGQLLDFCDRRMGADTVAVARGGGNGGFGEVAGEPRIARRYYHIIIVLKCQVFTNLMRKYMYITILPLNRRLQISTSTSAASILYGSENLADQQRHSSLSRLGPAIEAANRWPMTLVARRSGSASKWAYLAVV